MIASKEYVQSKLNEYSLFPLKKFGQNFLIDISIVNQTISAMELKKGDIVYEIGPGLGALSEVVAGNDVTLYLFDIDENMVNHLKKTFQYYPNVNVILKDFLKVYPKNNVNKIVGNLPYYITTPLIEHVLLNYNFESFVFMVQKEVEDRLVADIQTKEYGPLSILIKQGYNIERVCKAFSQSFFPKPHVDSMVFKITPKEEIINKTKYYKFLKAMFLMRRKTILNNLSTYLNSKEKAIEFLKEEAIELNLRPEQLTQEQFNNLYQKIAK